MDKGIIPEDVADATLYELLMLQMEKQMVLNLVVPKVVGNGSFAGQMNCQRMRIGKLNKVGKYMDQFEKETGVSMNYNFRLALSSRKRKNLAAASNNNWSDTKKHKKSEK